jgi:NAD(P)-dependent dehydrogenase (short-subunit alcohol dehydrogenase family)
MECGAGALAREFVKGNDAGALQIRGQECPRHTGDSSSKPRFLMSASQSNPATPSSRLKGKVALITGATRGIGRAIARSLADEGCDLAVTGRNSAALEGLNRELSAGNIRVLAHPCDVRDPKAVDALISDVQRQFQSLDIVVNNAGISHAMATADKLAVEVWNDVIATNLTGMFLVTRAALPLMPDGGAIVNNLSVAAKEVFAGEAAYCASKHGALGFTNTLREELRPRRIRVVALMPGATDTEIWNQFWPDAPRQKMLSPETVAQAVVNALLLPSDATAEELIVKPTTGKLS